MSRVDHGQVEFELGDNTITLKPTLKALMRIEAHFGGMRAAIERCGDLSLDGLAVIVAAGAGMKPKDIQEDLFAEGITNVLPHATEYLLLLLNPTGKEAEEQPEGE